LSYCYKWIISKIQPTHLAQKDKHVPPVESRDENEQQDLISVKRDESKDNIVDDWLIEHFKNKLKKAAAIIGALNKPLPLYCGIIEEDEDSAKEEIVLHNQKYISVQIFTRGGYLPTTFHEQHVFTIDKFISWIIKERKDRNMILQCIEAVENSI
jgi:desulfoferrodoxin (superoxide reductase-like protein)